MTTMISLFMLALFIGNIALVQGIADKPLPLVNNRFTRVGFKQYKAGDTLTLICTAAYPVTWTIPNDSADKVAQSTTTVQLPY
jgi:hypothetical protein